MTKNTMTIGVLKKFGDSAFLCIGTFLLHGIYFKVISKFDFMGYPIHFLVKNINKNVMN